METKSLQIPEYVKNSNWFERWMKFHLDNRSIIRLILKELERAKSRGLNKVSIKQICGKIRWEHTLETKSNDFKINDAYTSIYAHIIAYNFPEYRDLFNRKQLRSKK